MRKFPVLRRIAKKGKAWCLLGPMYELHIGMVHKARDFILATHDWSHLEKLPPATKELCDACRNTMAEILDVPRRRLHCTLKVLMESDTPNKPALVVTIGRSEPLNRPPEYGTEHAHLVESNTVFSALCGKNDSNRNWQPYSYFCCNDLTKHIDEFRCDRTTWPKYYKSTLALPLRFPKAEKNGEYKILGFLTFDMPTTGQFYDVPDVYTHDFNTYQELLGGSSVVHTAAIMADILTLLLRPMLDNK